MWGAPPPPAGAYYPPPTVYHQQAPAPYGAAPPPPAGAGWGYPGAAYPQAAPPPPAAPAYPAHPTWGPPPQAAQPPSAPAAPQDASRPAAPSAPPAPAAPAPAYGAPPPPAPLPPPVPYGPPKKAVLIGCTYPGTNAALNGCINDVKCMKHMLMTRFGFQESNIIVLKDDVYHPDWFPTRANIMRAIQWLMTGLVPGTSLFFHFSGHGSQKADYTGDEEDGLDETILPTDYKQAGQIVDDELNAMLVRPLPQGVVMHAVVDACHSGTVLDLPYRTKYKSGLRWKGRPNPSKATWGGTALQFGACRDSQVAQDTNRMSGSVHTGAATFSFIQAVERGGAQQSYAQLLAAMSHALEPGGTSSTGMTDMVFGLLLGGSMSSGQTPVLSCDKMMDLNTRLML